MNFERLKGKTLLIVDDEPDLRGPLVLEFESLGCKVFEAASGRAAFELVKSQRIDAVVSDIRMPDGDGIELLKNIKELNYAFPVVMLITGFSDLSREDAYHLGAEAVLSKPFDLDQLDEAVIRILTPLAERPVLEENGASPNQVLIVHEFETFLGAIGQGKLKLGRGGMFIPGAIEKIFPNQNVHLNIKFSSGDILSIEAKGIIRWVRRDHTEHLPAGYGIEFEALSQTAQAVLLKISSESQVKSFIPKA